MIASKGRRLHRIFGSVFGLAMLTTAVLSIYLAAFMPPSIPGGAPAQASAAVGVLTIYFVTTSWMTVRRKQATVSPTGAFLAAVAIASILVTFGLQAQIANAGHPAAYVPYYVFGSFAALAGGLDLKVVIQGGFSGVARIARHLWRMCFAWFFACAFFFIGQQKVMPAAMHGSPILFALSVMPLILLIVWLFRINLKSETKHAMPVS